MSGVRAERYGTGGRTLGTSVVTVLPIEGRVHLHVVDEDSGVGPSVVMDRDAWDRLVAAARADRR